MNLESHPMVDRLLRAVNLLSAAGAVIGGVLFTTMTLLILAEVMLRMFFDKSTLVASEYSGYLLAAMVYLSLAFSFRDGAQIRISFMKERLKGLPLHILEIGCTSIAAILCILSSIFLWDMVKTSFERGVVAYSVVETPLWIPQSFVFAGILLLLFQVLAYLLYLIFRGPGAVESNPVSI